MNKRQKECIQAQLDSEKAVLEQLEKQYTKALNDIDKKIRILQSDELTQSRIYRLEYQKALKEQVKGVLEKLHSDEYTTIQQFLSASYTDAFVGTAYDLFGQGVPLIMPIDPEEAVKAVLTDSKINGSLYEALGVDVNKLKKSISSEISRGIAGGASYNEITRNISSTTKAPLSRVRTIVQTESHRIQQAARHNARVTAKSKGADIVKQWNSTLDGGTRDTHRKLDGQIRELDEPFEVGGMKAMYPGDFGDPAEDCNCRCEALQRAKWALGEAELETLKERAKYFDLDKTKDFDDFKEKYIKTLDKIKESDIIKSFEIGKSIGAAAKKYPVKMPESNQHVKLAEDQKIEGIVFAGKGAKKEIRDRFRLEATYNHPADEWQKVSGVGNVIVDGKPQKAELHWYEADGDIVEMKVKRFYDES